MNRIDQTFARLKRSHRKALIGYLTAGFPSKAIFINAVTRLEKAGLDFLEVGIPFSDPVADGPTIQLSSQKALQNGVTLSWTLKTVKTLRKKVQIPILFMSYTNPLLMMGLDRFFAAAKAAGVDGVIIPDLIPEEGAPFEAPAKRHGLAIVYLAAPTSPRDRLSKIAQATKGFLYAVSFTGVTGARKALPADVAKFLSHIRTLTSKPLAVGFGISSPEQVRSMRKQADGIIVGSALINHLEKSLGNAEQFVASLQKALNPNGSKGVHHAS